jgi:hypothetical protein
MERVSKSEQLAFPFAKDYERWKPTPGSNIVELGLHTREDKSGIKQPVDCAFLPFEEEPIPAAA